MIIAALQNTGLGESCDVEHNSRKLSISVEQSDNDQMFPAENMMYTNEADEVCSVERNSFLVSFCRFCFYFTVLDDWSGQRATVAPV